MAARCLGLDHRADAGVRRERDPGSQVSDFPGPGIALAAATDNLIGGDRGKDAGPFGQGNLTVRNYAGISLWSDGVVGASLDTVTGNLVGTDAGSANDLGNHLGFMIADGARDNTIGPDNVIARNRSSGVDVAELATVGNTIARSWELAHWRRLIHEHRHDFCQERIPAS